MQPKTEQMVVTELPGPRQLEKLNSEGWEMVIALLKPCGQPYVVFKKVKT